MKGKHRDEKFGVIGQEEGRPKKEKKNSLWRSRILPQYRDLQHCSNHYRTHHYRRPTEARGTTAVVTVILPARYPPVFRLCCPAQSKAAPATQGSSSKRYCKKPRIQSTSLSDSVPSSVRFSSSYFLTVQSRGRVEQDVGSREFPLVLREVQRKLLHLLLSNVFDVKMILQTDIRR